MDGDRQKSDDDCVRRGADSSLRGGVDADLRDMTISPDVMDLESEDNQNSYQGLYLMTAYGLMAIKHLFVNFP